MELEATVKVFDRKVKNNRMLAIYVSIAAFMLYITGGSLKPNQVTIVAATSVVFLIYLYSGMSLSRFLYNRKLKKAQVELNIMNTHE